MTEALTCENLHFSYGAQAVFEGLDFKVSEGEFLGIVGPNGSGKTTLLKVLNRLLVPEQGRILFKGQSLADWSPRERALHLAMVPQVSTFAFPFSVLEVVLLGRYPHLGGLALEGQDDYQRARRVLEELDLQGFESRLISDLSGGEKQRVCIAKALAQEPQLLLCDEPTSFLDIKHQMQICSLLKQLSQTKKLTIISVFHDLNLAACFCERLMVLKEGKIHKIDSPERILTKETLSEVFQANVHVENSEKWPRPFYLPHFEMRTS